MFLFLTDNRGDDGTFAARAPASLLLRPRGRYGFPAGGESLRALVSEAGARRAESGEHHKEVPARVAVSSAEPRDPTQEERRAGRKLQSPSRI